MSQSPILDRFAYEAGKRFAQNTDDNAKEPFVLTKQEDIDSRSSHPDALWGEGKSRAALANYFSIGLLAGTLDVELVEFKLSKDMEASYNQLLEKNEGNLLATMKTIMDMLQEEEPQKEQGPHTRRMQK